MRTTSRRSACRVYGSSVSSGAAGATRGRSHFVTCRASFAARCKRISARHLRLFFPRFLQQQRWIRDAAFAMGVYPIARRSHEIGATITTVRAHHLSEADETLVEKGLTTDMVNLTDLAPSRSSRVSPDRNARSQLSRVPAHHVQDSRTLPPSGSALPQRGEVLEHGTIPGGECLMIDGRILTYLTQSHNSSMLRVAQTLSDLALSVGRNKAFRPCRHKYMPKGMRRVLQLTIDLGMRACHCLVCLSLGTKTSARRITPSVLRTRPYGPD